MPAGNLDWPRRKMRVLVTNDDGVDAEGFGVLVAFAIEQGFDVLAAAPAVDVSGSGTSRSVPVTGDISITSHRLPSLPGFRAHTVTGPPALIVSAACQGIFGPPPELVLAGINEGANIGRVLHSGTVGAALTAQRYQQPGIALSIDGTASPHWRTALLAFEHLLPLALATKEDRPPVVLNINAPNIPPADLRGIRAAAPARQSATHFTLTIARPGIVQAGYRHVALPRLQGDAAALAAGYATVTALRAVEEDTTVQLPVPRWPD
ncbi:5'/3'-nucleotidase SurE [Streptomyces sp. 1222.5]|uniref:5'/3'-nucleotidase SurE n=1 Tax=Streptomyces sp. 1222.5 TaxID=1881026 RepID=UPI003D716FC2